MDSLDEHLKIEEESRPQEVKVKGIKIFLFYDFAKIKLLVKNLYRDLCTKLSHMGRILLRFQVINWRIQGHNN